MVPHVPRAACPSRWPSAPSKAEDSDRGLGTASNLVPPAPLSGVRRRMIALGTAFGGLSICLDAVSGRLPRGGGRQGVATPSSVRPAGVQARSVAFRSSSKYAMCPLAEMPRSRLFEVAFARGLTGQCEAVGAALAARRSSSRSLLASSSDLSNTPLACASDALRPLAVKR